MDEAAVAAAPMDEAVVAAPTDPGLAVVPMAPDLAVVPTDAAAVEAVPMDVSPFRPPESGFPPSPKSRSLLRLRTHC